MCDGADCLFLTSASRKTSHLTRIILISELRYRTRQPTPLQREASQQPCLSLCFTMPIFLAHSKQKTFTAHGSRAPAAAKFIANLAVAPLALAAAQLAGAQTLPAITTTVAQATTGSALPAALVNISIAAQPLADALNDWSKQTRVQLTVPPNLVAGKSAPAVTGSLSPRQALDRLLAGSGLMASAEGSTIVIRPTPGTSKPMSGDGRLPAVTVTANANDQTAWGPVNGYAAKRSATGTKTDTPILETPASVQVVPREVMEDQKAANLKDVYENVSGVQQAGNTLNAQTEVLPIIRGFESPSLMRNGLRSTVAGAVDLINVERVEVLKGPASILYGALEPGGIVNYVTKRPQGESSHVFEQQIGSYDWRRTSGDSTGSLNSDGSLLYRFNFAQTNSNSFRNSMNLERTAVAPSLLWKIKDQTELLLDFSYVKEKQPYDAGIPVDANGKPRVSRSTFFGDPDLAGRTNEDFYAGYQLSHTVNSTWSLRNQLQFHSAHNKNESLRPRGISGNNLTMRYQNEDRTDDELQFVLDGTAKFSTGAIDHTLLIGAEHIEQDSDFRRFRVNVPNVPISDNPNVNFNPPANQARTADLSKTRWSSLYLQDQISLLDGGRLKLLLGGRFDDVLTQGSSGGVASADVKASAFTGRAGLLYRLSNQHSAYVSTSQSFRPQFAFAVDTSGKPLDPETGRQYELGFKSSFLNDRLLATVSLFDIEKKNVAAFDQALFDSTGRSAYFPGVKQRSRGVEFDLTGNLTRQLKVIASYAYTDTEVLQNAEEPAQVGKPLGGVAPHAARVWLAYDFDGSSPLAGFGVGGGARYVGKSTAQFDTTKLEPYTVADVGVWYGWKNIKASLNVKNLFNKNYIARASTNAIAHPGAPRTVVASVSIGF